MADLPDVPQAAIDAAWAVIRRIDAADRDAADIPATAIHAAWPHLYAAALRHAADTLDQDTANPNDSRDIAALRRMADEATP